MDCRFSTLLTLFTNMFEVAVGCFGSRFGHDRAKNDSGIVFLAQAVNRLCDCMYAMVGLWNVLGVGMGAWFA